MAVARGRNRGLSGTDLMECTDVCSLFFFFSSRRRHTRCGREWSSDVCSSDLIPDEGYIQQFTDLYMKDHRRNFDTPDREIDPAQSVIEAFRRTKEYQTIHRLRPDSEDERSWVRSEERRVGEGGR